MSFYLVQRLEQAVDRGPVNAFASDPGTAKTLHGAGAGIDLAYMGSYEFEDGSVARSGSRIVAVTKDLSIVTQKLVRPTYTEDVHFVCTPEQEQDVLPEWHEWAKKPRTKDSMAYFRDDYRDMIVSRPEEVVGWWAIKEDLIWSRETEVAERIRGAFITLAAQAEASS